MANSTTASSLYAQGSHYFDANGNEITPPPVDQNGAIDPLATVDEKQSAESTSSAQPQSGASEYFPEDPQSPNLSYTSPYERFGDSAYLYQDTPNPDTAYLEANSPDSKVAPPVASSYDPGSTDTNPNEANAKAASVAKENPTPENQAKINSNDGEPHGFSSKEIQDLETKSKLSNNTLAGVAKGLGHSELGYIKYVYCQNNINKYYLFLNMLVYGFDNKILSAWSNYHNAYVIDKPFMNDFYAMEDDPLLNGILSKTPAYKKGCFTPVGMLGINEINADAQPNHPATGPKTSHPSILTDLMEKIHKGSVQQLEDFCNKIRTHAWLNMPKGSFGSLGRMIAGINGVIQAFQTIVNDIYNGMIYYIQKVYALINGAIAELQKQFMKVIDQIIPLDLLCLLLDTFQTILDDIGFFTSLFNMSGPFLNYLGSIQSYLNVTSSFVSNPFSTVSAFFPPQVQNVINQFNQIGSDPGGYLSDKLANYGYSWAATALQGNIVGALTNKLGPQYASFNPVGNYLAKAGAIYNRFGQGAQLFPPVAASMGPNLYNGGRTDGFGNPINPGDLGQILSTDFTNLGNAFTTLGGGLSGVGADISSELDKIGNTFKKYF